MGKIGISHYFTHSPHLRQKRSLVLSYSQLFLFLSIFLSVKSMCVLNALRFSSHVVQMFINPANTLVNV